MRQASVVATLLIFFVVFLAALGGMLFLWQENGVLAATAVAQSTANHEAQGTLVAVLAERQAEMGTQAAVSGTRAAELGAAQALMTTQEAAVTAMAAEMETLRGLISSVVGEDGTPEAVVVEQAAAGPVVIRLWLKNPLTTRQVGQPVTVIASAAHPEGIAGLNIAVNGEPLLVDSPTDPALHTSTVRFVPRAAGEYRFTALATTARGRGSETAALTITVVEVGADINSEIRRKIEEQVVALRGLPLLEPVFPLVMDRFELAERLGEDALIALDREELALRSIGLSAFDFVPPGYDLYEATIATLSVAVAGFYEPTTNELMVVSDGDVMTQFEQLIYAHEFMHALQDQHFQLELIGGDSLNSDERLALRSLGEGEAELIEFLYEARGFLTGEELGENELLYGTPEFAGAYDFLINDFNFPYTRGYDFVDYLYQEGGFAAVNAAWARLPQSTEQILHPEKYVAGDAPQTVVVPELDGVLDGSWVLAEADVLGEFYLREYLALQMDSQTAAAAAAGWGGDYYRVYYQPEGDAVLLLLRIVWDDRDEQEEFITTFEMFRDGRMGEAAEQTDVSDGSCVTAAGEAFCLFVSDLETVIVRVPTVALAADLYAYVRQ